MKYLFVEKNAVEQIATTRALQSSEFEQSREVSSFLREFDSKVVDGVAFQVKKDGAFIYSLKKCDINNAVIFDLEKFADFNSLSTEDTITIFQKILKYSIKHWANLPLSPCERSLSDGKHCIIYPLPYTNTNAYRVLVNNIPDNNFTDRRNLNYIYVAGSGTGHISTDYPILNLKRIREDAQDICVAQPKQEPLNRVITSFEVNALDDLKCNTISPAMGFEKWMHHLTINQKRFVKKGINGSERLEGAAGTGKTLTMILRAINVLRDEQQAGNECHMVFITHSIATKNQIMDIFIANYPEVVNMFDRNHSYVSIEITTLQEWCIAYLGGGLGRTEFLDRDAQETKELQLLYLEEAFDKCIQNDFGSYKLFCSSEFVEFINTTPKNSILEMLQMEVAITIKGRANENIELYRTLPRIKYSMPLYNEGDFNFVYLVFEKYQKTLSSLGYFDNDDITLSAIGQLNTPIWRRRKKNEGYHAIFIDETHLFNYNELSVFHHLCRNEKEPNIIFAIDKSQAIGDRGLTNDFVSSTLGVNVGDERSHYNTVFRSSPEIVNLAFAVLSSGATLFTNFENPLDKVNFSFTVDEDRKSKVPVYLMKENDEEMIHEAFRQADVLCNDLSIKKHKVLIICTTSSLLNQTEQIAAAANKPYEVIKQRGDIEVVRSAEKMNRYVLGMIDYVGGLEFDAVIILGVDKGRVPTVDEDEHKESLHFQSYAWHSRMYVAITRAKYAVVLMGERTRGESVLLSSSVASGMLTIL